MLPIWEHGMQKFEMEAAVQSNVTNQQMCSAQHARLCMLVTMPHARTDQS